MVNLRSAVLRRADGKYGVFLIREMSFLRQRGAVNLKFDLPGPHPLAGRRYLTVARCLGFPDASQRSEATTIIKHRCGSDVGQFGKVCLEVDVPDQMYPCRKIAVCCRPQIETRSKVLQRCPSEFIRLVSSQRRTRSTSLRPDKKICKAAAGPCPPNSTMSPCCSQAAGLPELFACND